MKDNKLKELEKLFQYHNRKNSTYSIVQTNTSFYHKISRTKDLKSQTESVHTKFSLPEDLIKTFTKPKPTKRPKKRKCTKAFTIYQPKRTHSGAEFKAKMISILQSTPFSQEIPVIAKYRKMQTKILNVHKPREIELTRKLILDHFTELSQEDVRNDSLRITRPNQDSPTVQRPSIIPKTSTFTIESQNSSKKVAAINIRRKSRVPQRTFT